METHNFRLRCFYAVFFDVLLLTESGVGAEDVFKDPIRGLNVKATTDDAFFFTQRNFMTRSFEKKNYLWPIRQTYIDNNPKLIQNLGY